MLQPSPLSSTYTATREDLLKDREAAAKRLNQFLVSNDEVDSTSSTSAIVTSASSAVLNPNGLKSNLEKAVEQSKKNQEPVSTSAPTTDSVKESLKLSSVSGKSVSFASPIATSIPSTTTTVSSLSTAGVSSTTTSGLKLPQIGLQASFGSSKTETSSLLSLKMPGGGLSLGNLATPPSTVATTSTDSQAAAAVSLTQTTTGDTLNVGAEMATFPATASILSSGQALGAASTQSNGLQVSIATATTTATLGANTTTSIFGSSVAQPQTQASGLQFGALNTTIF